MLPSILEDGGVLILVAQIYFSKNATYFEQIYCPSSGVSTLYTHQQIFVMLVMSSVC
jgi:hypothetical protein